MFHSFTRKKRKPKDEVHSNKPEDTPFRQQKLPAWQPVLTVENSLPLFLGIGIVFIPIGITILVTSKNVKELSTEYTNCVNDQNQRCSDVIAKNISQRCVCNFPIHIDEDMTGDVYFYYGLKNYWQNLRRYVESRDDDQLLGCEVTKLTDKTEPFRRPYLNSSVFYAPAGAIGNSMFNDSFELQYETGTRSITVPWLNTGIAWETDTKYKFDNPTTFEGSVKPVFWTKNASMLDPRNPNNTGYRNEDFIVWMRTAAMPTFRKLYRRLDRLTSSNLEDNLFRSALPSGNYIISIEYNYPTADFKCQKFFIIATTSWLGSRNDFLGVMYLVVGMICIITEVVFFALKHEPKRRRQRDSSVNVNQADVLLDDNAGRVAYHKRVQDDEDRDEVAVEKKAEQVKSDYIPVTAHHPDTFPAGTAGVSRDSLSSEYDM